MIVAKLDTKLLRIKSGLYQKEVAHAIGLTTTTYCQIERAQKSTTCKTAWKIADYFGVAFDDLFVVIDKEARYGKTL